jgi:hypothetical protein
MAMDLEETEDNSECAGESQQQFNQPTDRRKYPAVVWLTSVGFWSADCNNTFADVIAVFCNTSLMTGSDDSNDIVTPLSGNS